LDCTDFLESRGKNLPQGRQAGAGLGWPGDGQASNLAVLANGPVGTSIFARGEQKETTKTAAPPLTSRPGLDKNRNPTKPFFSIHAKGRKRFWPVPLAVKKKTWHGQCLFEDGYVQPQHLEPDSIDWGS